MQRQGHVVVVSRAAGHGKDPSRGGTRPRGPGAGRKCGELHRHGPRLRRSQKSVGQRRPSCSSSTIWTPRTRSSSTPCDTPGALSHARLHSCSQPHERHSPVLHTESSGLLDADAVAELAATIAGEAALALPLDAVLDETEGLPLAVQEIVAEWLRAEASRRLGKLLSARRPAGRSCGPPRQTSRVAWSTSSRLSTEFDADVEAAERVCPFKGLASFDVADADTFFGREQLVAEPVARLPGATLLGVVGPSGSGKSSIVRAGPSAALASGALPGSEEWLQVVIRPGEHPLDELARRGATERARGSCSSSISSRRSSRSAATRPSACAVPRRAHASRSARNGCHRRQGRLLRALCNPQHACASSPRTTSLSAR